MHPHQASPTPCVSQPVLRATTTSIGTVQTVTVSGEMDVSTVPQVATLLDRAISERPEILVLDLSDVGFCDSSGIHAVVKTHHRAETARICFRVIPPAGPARRVFEICSIDEFVSFVTVEDASAASAA